MIRLSTVYGVAYGRYDSNNVGRRKQIVNQRKRLGSIGHTIHLTIEEMRDSAMADTPHKAEIMSVKMSLFYSTFFSKIQISIS